MCTPSPASRGCSSTANSRPCATRAGGRHGRGDGTRGLALAAPVRLGVHHDVELGSRRRAVRGPAVHLRDTGVVAARAAPGRPAWPGRGDLSGGAGPSRRAAACHVPRRDARRNPERCLWPLGHLRARPVAAHVGPARARTHARILAALPGAAVRRRHAGGRADPRHHDRALHHGGESRSAARGASHAARGRAGARSHRVGDDADRRPPLRPFGTHRRHPAGLGTRSRRDDGRHDVDRQPPGGLVLAVRAGLHDGERDRQRVHRGDVRSVPRRAHRDRAAPARSHAGRERAGAAPGVERGPRPHGGAGVTSTRWRQRVSASMAVLTAAAAGAVILPLVLIFGFLLWQGASAINVDFFTHLPKPVGEVGGGMANAIIGTLILLGLASLLGLPIGILGGVYLAESRDRRLPWIVRFLADVLNGVPSIVIGIFAYTLVVLPMRRFSAVAGGVALAVIMLPIVVRTTEEMVRLVPASLREAGLALGVPEWKVVLRVVLPTARAGIVPGAMVAVARVAGETAPLLFTAFGNRFWHQGLDQPIAALPLQIFAYAIAPYDDWHRQAWAGALVLICLVFIVSLFARLATRGLAGQPR